MRSSTDLLTWQLFFRMAVGTARGIAHLHSLKPEILHRDLKSLNLLVTDDYNIKVRVLSPPLSHTAPYEEN
jgi:serine/threonine protein kinase